MGYQRLLLVSPPPPPPPPQGLSLRTRSRRGPVTAATWPDAARSPSVVAASSAATRRRAVLLVGVSVLPLIRLRDAAVAAAAAQSSTVDIVTGDDKRDFQKIKGTHPEEHWAEPPHPEVKGPSSGNPFAGLLNAIAVIASGVLAGILGTSQREKKALQSTISSMEIKLAENEAEMSSLRNIFEKMLLDEQAEHKKQASMFQDQEASLLDQLASTKRAVTSSNEEVMREKELVKQLKHEMHQLESIIAQSETNKHELEGKLREKLETLDILHDKVNLLSHDVNDKEEYIRELTSSLTSKEGDYHILQLIYNQTRESLEHANSKIEQLGKDVLAAKDDLQSKISSIDSLNEEVRTLYIAESKAKEKISELIKQYADLETASEIRASCDAELLFNKDGQLNQLEERLCSALNDSTKDRAIIAELHSELETNRRMVDNEVESRRSLSNLVQSTEEVLKDSKNEVLKLSEELNEANISNQDLTTQISKLTDERNEVKQAMTNKIAEVESVSRTLSDEVASVKEMLQKRQEDLEVTSSQLLYVTEAHGELKKELLHAYKKLESTTNELVSERKINATLSRELEALVKQSLVDSEARRTLQADLDEATLSLNEVTESTIFLSNKLDSTNSMISAIKEEKDMLSKALVDQKGSTVDIQKNILGAQNQIKRLGAERQNFEMKSNKLEDELATAKGEILRLRRHISASGSQKTNVLVDASEPSNIIQPLKEEHMNGLVPITCSTNAEAPRSAKKIYRRRKGKSSS